MNQQQRIVAIGGSTAIVVLLGIAYWFVLRKENEDDDDDEDDFDDTKQTKSKNQNNELPDLNISVASAGQFSTEIFIPKRIVGVIIGRGGANIKELRNEFAVR